MMTWGVAVAVADAVSVVETRSVTAVALFWKGLSQPSSSAPKAALNPKRVTSSVMSTNRTGLGRPTGVVAAGFFTVLPIEVLLVMTRRAE